MKDRCSVLPQHLARDEAAPTGVRSAVADARRTANAGFMALAAAIIVTITGAAGDAPDVDRGLADFQQGRFAEALQDWRQAAAAGDSSGALYVGVLYDSGVGVTQDYRQAMAWYRQAADAGSAIGALNVAILYDAGLGVPKAPKQAALWYDRAAVGGSGRAAYDLGVLYETGAGVPRRRDLAVTMFRRAAALGVSAARDHLAALGQPFAGEVRKPQDSAMRAFQQAQQLLLNRGTADAERMAALFRSSAKQHNPLAEYDLGYCYERGLGVPRDQVQADDWYRRAAEDTTDGTLRATAQLAARNLEGQIRQAQLHRPEPSTVPQAGQGSTTGESGHSD